MNIQSISTPSSIEVLRLEQALQMQGFGSSRKREELAEKLNQARIAAQLRS